MQARNYNKIQYFKNRFIQILDYLGSDKAISAANEIEKLPDFATDGYHDAYLIAKIISITLFHMPKKEFNRFKNDFIRSSLLAALFGQSDIENQESESIDNVFSFCEQYPQEFLEESFQALFGEDGEDPLRSVYEEIQVLKTSCQLFIKFYEKNKADLSIAASHFPDSILIEDTHKGPHLDDLKNATFLPRPDDKWIMKNTGKSMIGNLRPCLGLVILAENANHEVACLTHHNYYFKLTNIKKAIEEMKLDGYKHEIRFFITGSDLNTFANALNLMMDYHTENRLTHIAHASFYLIPSPQNCAGYCLVNLVDGKFTIQTGSELYDNDISLCEERGIVFLDSRSEDENSLSSDDSNEVIETTEKRKWMMFQYSNESESNEEEPKILKRPRK